MDRVRWFAEGGLAGVLVRRDRWRVLVRFHGPESEERARALAALLGAAGLMTGSELRELGESTDEA